jgi:hypothetical protein
MENYLGNDPDILLRELQPNPEVLRAFAVACCRQVWSRLDERGRAAVALAGRFTEGQATLADLAGARAQFGLFGEDTATLAVYFALARDPMVAAREASWYAATALVGRHASRSQWQAQRAAQVQFLLRLEGKTALVG